MDRQRAAVLVTVGVVVAFVLLAFGVVVGRASTGDGEAEPGNQPETEELASGPSGLADGVPVGFSKSEEGALGAAVAWVPWLVSSPASERPEGMDTVLAQGVEPPMPDGISERLQFVPWAARVDAESDVEVTVTLLGTPLRGEVGDDLDGGIWPLDATLVWDDAAGDWRVSAVDTTADLVEPPVKPEDVSGYRVLRSYGGTLAGPVMEEVPGD